MTQKSLWWLTYARLDGALVFIQEANTCLSARLKACRAGMKDRDFREGHLLPAKFARMVPGGMLGRKLSGTEAAALLEKMR
jgi:hypothetical protein